MIFSNIIIYNSLRAYGLARTAPAPVFGVSCIICSVRGVQRRGAHAHAPDEPLSVHTTTLARTAPQSYNNNYRVLCVVDRGLAHSDFGRALC